MLSRDQSLNPHTHRRTKKNTADCSNIKDKRCKRLTKVPEAIAFRCFVTAALPAPHGTGSDIVFVAFLKFPRPCAAAYAQGYIPPRCRHQRLDLTLCAERALRHNGRLAQHQCAPLRARWLGFGPVMHPESTAASAQRRRPRRGFDHLPPGAHQAGVGALNQQPVGRDTGRPAGRRALGPGSAFKTTEGY